MTKKKYQLLLTKVYNACIHINGSYNINYLDFYTCTAHFHFCLDKLDILLKSQLKFICTASKRLHNFKITHHAIEEMAVLGYRSQVKAIYC